jgi:integrase
MGIYRRDKTWWFSFSLDGKQVRRSTNIEDKKLAEAFAKSYEAAALEGRLNPFRRKDATVGEVLTRYLNVHIKPNRPSSYQMTKYIVTRMTNFFGSNLPISQLRPKVDEYKAKRKEVVGSATLNRNLVILKAACNKAVEWNLISANPLAKYRMDKVSENPPMALEDSEFKILMDRAHPDLAPVILFARHTGMRPAEFRALEWPDMDLEKGWARLRTSKSGDSRMVPLTQEIVDCFSRVPKERRIGHVFKHKGKPLNRQGFSTYQFNKARKAAKLPKNVIMYSLRHTWATQAARRGVDLRTIAEVMGHKSMRMLMRYAHLSKGHMKISMQLAAPQNYHNFITNGSEGVSEKEPLKNEIHPNSRVD